MSGVSWQSKTLVLEPVFVMVTLAPMPSHFLPILSFLTKVLSIKEARTEMTRGVLESFWYEYEYTSFLSFLGDMAMVYRKSLCNLKKEGILIGRRFMEVYMHIRVIYRDTVGREKAKGVRT